MSTTRRSPDKRIVEELNFSAKTAKRVGWEAWEFTVVGPHQVEVTNASYGIEKDDHSYVVGVDEGECRPIPAECECPADQYNDDQACKHRVALATVGGPVVLNAAVTVESPARPSSQLEPDRLTTGDELLKTDGGTASVATGKDTETETCKHGVEGCPGPTGDDLSCYRCYSARHRGGAQ